MLVTHSAALFQFLSDILDYNAWEADRVEDKSLIALLPGLLDLQLSSKSPATIVKYRSGWKKWSAWATSKIAVGVLPADPLHVALFYTETTKEESRKGTAYSSLEAISYSIAWVHNMCSLISPTNSAVVLKFTGFL